MYYVIYVAIKINPDSPWRNYKYYQFTVVEIG